MTIESEGGTLWIGTAMGLYKWDNAPKGKLERHDIGTVYVMLRDHDTLWIGSERGLFHLDKSSQEEKPQFIPGSPKSVNRLYKFGPRLLMNATNGLFVLQVSTRKLTHFDLAGSYVYAFCPDSNNKLWIGTDRGLLSWDSAENKPRFASIGENVEVTSLYKEDSTLLIGTSRGLLRWVDVPAGSGDWVFTDAEVYSLYKDNSTLLISAPGKGLLSLNNVREGQPEIIDSEINISSKYVRSGSILWMGASVVVTKAGLYQWDSQTEKKPRRIDRINTGTIHHFYRSGQTLWIGAERGLFRIEGLDTEWDANLEITNELPKTIYTDHNLLIKWHVGNFGWRTTPEQVQYHVVVKDAGGQEVKTGGWEVSCGQEFTLPSLEEGSYRLYVQATDLNGKIATSPPKRFSVNSFWKNVLFQVLIIMLPYGALILLAIILAPFSTLCHDLLMNPWVRNVGSLGLIPLALTVIRPARRHILKRYFHGVKSDKEFLDWQARFVMPTEDFLPDSYGARLADEKRLLLVGQSGIGKTSYFKYLTGHYAQRKDTPPVGAIPVFLPLARYRGVLPEDMFSAQLANYGRLTDEKLNNWFLKQGGFVIFIDGLNEVDESTRNKINTFVDQHWKANYFCISSQQPYPEFAGIERVQLASLSEDKIKEFLQRRLGDDQAQAIVNRFDGDIHDIYKIPQDLEFAIELKKRSPMLPIPRSKMELYEATLSPILNAWVEEDHADYPYLLFHRAYEMLCSRDAFFDNSDTPLPDDLLDRLVEKRYLIRRSDHYLFRHDLVRSYLASKYFSHRWRDLLSDEELGIDDNWRPMLEFFLIDLKQPSEARDVLERILVKNKWLAGELFSWIEVTTPSLCNGWATDFKLKFADAMLISV